MAKRRDDGQRLAVRRTPKLYIGGAFPRSESGRTDVLTLDDGGSANVVSDRFVQAAMRCIAPLRCVMTKVVVRHAAASFMKPRKRSIRRKTSRKC